MKNLHISAKVASKLTQKHGVSQREVEQCFSNRTGRLLEDKRVSRATVPPTLWFLACTNQGRLLKVVYIQTENTVELKTAYEPNADEVRIYKHYG